MKMNPLAERTREFKQVLKCVLKDEMQLLLRRLSEIGEEALVITASLSEGIDGQLGSSVGEGFLQSDNRNLVEIRKDFRAYCKASANRLSSAVPQLNIVPSHYNIGHESSYHCNPPSVSHPPPHQPHPPPHPPPHPLSHPLQDSDKRKTSDSIPPDQPTVQRHHDHQPKQGPSSASHGKPTLPVFEKVFGEKQMKSYLLKMDTDFPSKKSKSGTDNTVTKHRKSIETFNLSSAISTNSANKIASHNDDQSKMLWMDYIEGNHSVDHQKQTTLESSQSDLPFHNKQHREGHQSTENVGMRIPYTISTQEAHSEPLVLGEDIVHTALVQTLSESERNALEKEMTVATNDSHHNTETNETQFQTENCKTSQTKNSCYSGVEIHTASRKSNPDGNVRKKTESDADIILVTKPADSKENILPLQQPCISHPPFHSSLQLSQIPAESSSSAEQSLARVQSHHDKPSSKSNNQTKHSAKSPVRTSVASADDSQDDQPGMSQEFMFEILGTKAKCILCGKVVLRRNRKYHWRFHTGQKPHKCGLCGKQFAHPSNLKTHCLTHKPSRDLTLLSRISGASESGF